jgi:hypothetical protein
MVYYYRNHDMGKSLLEMAGNYGVRAILGRHPMEQFEKILILDNEIEAELLDSILIERDIPHLIQSYHDSAYDGIYQAQKGWGVVMAPEAFKEVIMSIYQDLPVKNPDGNEEDLTV